jgi:hypothetical protein
MIKAQMSPNLISFLAIRRGDWVIKVSVYRNKEVLLLAQNYFDKDRFIIEHFSNHDDAADYIECLAKD